MTTGDPGGVQGPQGGVQPVRASDLAISLIRTWVPIAVGAILAWLAATKHVLIPAHASAAAGAFATSLAAAAYYALARLLERSNNATVRAIGGYLLGGTVSPVYLDAAQSARIIRRTS